MLVFAFAAGGASPCERRAGGLDADAELLPGDVVNNAITDVRKFEQEVKKCSANPVTYPPACHQPTCWRGLRKGELREPP
jgi:hypothetical protein